MQLFNRNADPVFLKEDSQAIVQLEELKKLKHTLNQTQQKQIDQQIRFLEDDIEGQDKIAFELKNSFMLMYVLKDIYLEYEGLSTQIDYLVFTRKHCYVIKCKNLHGHIEITPKGDFLRLLFSNDGQEQKEGIYSPITQNQQSLGLIKKIALAQKRNSILKLAANKFFDDYYKPLVVMANPKSIVHKKYAKKEIRDQVIRADQLVAYIETMDRQSSERLIAEKELAARAHAFLKMHQESKKVATKPAIINIPVKNHAGNKSRNQFRVESVSEVPAKQIKDHPKLFNVLATYRLLKSQEEGSNPHSIYTDIELADLIRKMPRNKRDLLQVEGFNPFKVQRYGPDLLKILSKYKQHLKRS